MRRAARILSLALVASCAHGPDAREATVPLELLAFNDFHGRLLPSADGTGGAAALAEAIRRHRKPSTLVVSSGDLVGASPLVSSHFHDEPTIEVMNTIGLDLLGVGNHEFDEGGAELERLRDGGPHPSMEATTPGFAGSRFRYLSANVIDEDGELMFDPYHVVEIDGVQVGFIAATLEGTKSIVPPVLGDITFLDEADSVARWVDVLKERGVEAFVLLLHEGGWHEGGPNDCNNLYGPVVDVVERLPQEIDVVLAGHTHQSYVCQREDVLLVSGGGYGQWLTKVELRLSRDTGDIVARAAENFAVHSDDGVDAEVAAIVGRYAEEIGPIARRDVGEVQGPILRAPLATGESPLGSVIADAQRYATKADLAFMNLGGIRDDLGTDDGELTYGDVFRVQPFDNRLVTKRYSGRQVLEILEAQWGATDEHGLFQVSETLRYCYHPNGLPGAKVDPDSVMVRGRVLDPEASYVVALNSYLAQKPPFNRGLGAVVHGKDVDALVQYVNESSPLPPPSLGRICRLDNATERASAGP